MKFKRITFFTSLALCATAVTSLVASAAEGTVSFGNAYLSGYVGGVEGPNVITDKIWYNGSLYGNDAQNVEQCNQEVYVEPGTDTTTLGKKYLWNSKRLISESKVSCGHGSSEARMTLHCGSNTTFISEPLA